MPVSLRCSLAHGSATTDRTITGDTCKNNLPTVENSKAKTNVIASKPDGSLSDDNFILPKKATKQVIDLSSSDDDTYTQNKTVKW